MFNLFKTTRAKKKKTNKRKQKRTKGILDCIITFKPTKQANDQIKNLIEADNMIKYEEGPPLFAMHIKNYQLMYHLVMLFFTMNLRMSYIYTRGVFYRWCLPMVFLSIWVAYRWRWKCNMVWVCVYVIMFIQNITDILGDQWFYLPKWFVLYPTIPLMVCSMLENILFVISRDAKLSKYITSLEKKREKRRGLGNSDDVDIEMHPLITNAASDDALDVRELDQMRKIKWKLVFVNLFVDKDVRNLYPISFEIYMLACALLLPITGGGIAFRNCVTDSLGLAIWLVFVMSEDSKIRSHEKMFRLPSFIVKVIYILYAPAKFWINMIFLILMNIMVTAEIKWREKNYYILVVLFMTILIYKDISILDSCPLMNY
jgi:hypothetical protein